MRHVKFIMSILCLLLLAGSACVAQVAIPSGLPQGLITNINFALSTVTSQQTITFTSPSQKIQIYLSPGSSNLYIDFNNVAATTGTSTAEVFSGGSETFSGSITPAIKVISDGGTGKAVVVAN